MATTTTVNAKAWFESKTILFNIITGVAFVLGTFVDSYQVLGIDIPDQAAAWVAMVSLIVNGYLRFTTNQPLASGRHQTAEVAAPERFHG